MLHEMKIYHQCYEKLLSQVIFLKETIPSTNMPSNLKCHGHAISFLHWAVKEKPGQTVINYIKFYPGDKENLHTSPVLSTLYLLEISKSLRTALLSTLCLHIAIAAMQSIPI